MNDILITDRIILNLNNRIIVFHNDDNKIGPSEFHVLSSYSNTESFDNYLYLRDYIKRFYSSNYALKSIIDDSYNFNQKAVLFILLEQFNEVIFEDVTNDSDLNNLHRGIFYLPTSLTLKQKENISKLKEYFKKFNQITLCHINVDSNYNIKPIPFKLINGDQIDKLEDFLSVQVQYTKHN